MQATSALKCKTLGKEIQNCDNEKWNQVASEQCFPGILSKFQQNACIASFLKNTGTKTILECCYDEVWGNSIPLSNPDCINPKKFKNQGILGSMLEQVREILLNPTVNTTNRKTNPVQTNPSSSQTLNVPQPNQSASSALPVETSVLSE